MSCPKCRTKLELDRSLYCPQCDVAYHPPINIKGIPIDVIKCINDAENSFYAKIGDAILVVRQPRIAELPYIQAGFKLASEYTYRRFSSWMWRHTEGVCHLPRHKGGEPGTLFLIMILDGKVVGHSIHKYWFLTEGIKEKEGFPIPVGSLCVNIELCVFDTYQRQGIGTVYAKVSEFIARHHGAEFIMGETFKEGGMLNIRMRDGWLNFGERKVEDGSTRVLIGRPLK